MKLESKVAIVTGGSQGIGYGIVEEYLKEGAKVLFCSRSEDKGKEALKEFEKIGDVRYRQGNVGNLDDLQMLVDDCVKEFSRLDIYVASAGINDPDKTPFVDVTSDQYDKIMDINLRGMFFGGQYAARQMIKQGDGGAIINMSSVNAYLGLHTQSVYTASKGAIQQLTKVQAISLAPYNIKVNAMAPGPIETDLMRRVGSDKELMNTILSRTPMGRIGTINECGRLAVFLVSNDSDFIFGQSIYNDGGRSFQAFPTPGYKTITDSDYEILQKIKKEDK